MKRLLTGMFVLLMILSLTFGMSACKKEVEEPKQEAPAQSEEEQPADNADIADTIEDIDTENMHDLPMQIERVVLYKDGSVLVVPTEDLAKNELKDGEAEGLYPFADSGKVKSIHLFNIGNAGYRTIVALLDDGSISGINPRALCDDHIIAVIDSIANRDDFVKVEQVETDSGFEIKGTTEFDEEIILDPGFNLDQEEPPEVIETEDEES